MANWLAFGFLTNQGVAPLEPGDFGKCLELLEIVPELREKLQDMSQVSVGWAALIARWQEVEMMFLTEVGLGWHKALVASKTCQLMREIYEGLGPAEMRSRPVGVAHA